jgi:hypothetical protein
MDGRGSVVPRPALAATRLLRIAARLSDNWRHAGRCYRRAIDGSIETVLWAVRRRLCPPRFGFGAIVGGWIRLWRGESRRRLELTGLGCRCHRRCPRMPAQGGDGAFAATW